MSSDRSIEAGDAAIGRGATPLMSPGTEGPAATGAEILECTYDLSIATGERALV
jgi:hypothetical protein